MNKTTQLICAATCVYMIAMIDHEIINQIVNEENKDAKNFFINTLLESANNHIDVFNENYKTDPVQAINRIKEVCNDIEKVIGLLFEDDDARELVLTFVLLMLERIKKSCEYNEDLEKYIGENFSLFTKTSIH